MELLEKMKNYVTEKSMSVLVPETTIADVDLKGFGLDRITLLATVTVSNPYSVPIPIDEIAYVMKSNERVIASDTIPDLRSLKANNCTHLEVIVKVPHSITISLVRDIGDNWDIDYTQA